MNLVLIGFRGTGKTTVGKILSKKLGCEFIDTDELIEKRHGFAIDEIFQRGAESLFRLKESDLINEVSKLDGRVIAVGGGAILKYKNAKNLKRHGVIFLLEASPRTIFQRITKDDKVNPTRHHLTGQELYHKIKNLFDLRYDYYHRASNYVVDTSGKSVDEVVDEIMTHLRNAGFIAL